MSDSAPRGDAPPGADSLRPRDAAALPRYADVRSVHAYTASWFNQATLVFPLLGSLIAFVVWAATGSGEAGGAAIFFAAVTAAMLPLVYLTWRRTTTAMVLHAGGLTALHQGAEQETLEWGELRGVRRVETMGNVRWYADGADERHIVIEGEIDRRDELIAALRERAPGRPPG